MCVCVCKIQLSVPHSLLSLTSAADPLCCLIVANPFLMHTPVLDPAIEDLHDVDTVNTDDGLHEPICLQNVSEQMSRCLEFYKNRAYAKKTTQNEVDIHLTERTSLHF
jgi:hypothetical protein